MTAPTAPRALPSAGASTERPELSTGQRSAATLNPAQPSARKALDAALLPWPLKLRRLVEEESLAEGQASEPGAPTRLTDAFDPAAIELAPEAGQPELLLAQATSGARSPANAPINGPVNTPGNTPASSLASSPVNAPVNAPADAATLRPAGATTSIESKLLTPLTQNAPWASASWFGAAPTGAAGTGALLAAAALGLGGGGGGGGSSPSTPADTRAPVLQSAEISNVGGTQLVLTYDENLTSTLPAASAFRVLVDGSNTNVNAVARGSDLKTVVLTLATGVTSAKTVKVSLGEGSQIRDGSGNVAATLRDQAVSVTDKTVPTLSSQTAITNASSSVVVLRYSEDLLGRPDAGQFQVKVDGVAQTVTAADVLGDSIRLSLRDRITATSPIVQLSFTQATDTTRAVQDAAGNRAAAIDAAGGITVSHSLDSTAPTLTSASNAVAAVDRSARQIRLTFTEALQAGSLPDASSLMVDVSSGGNTRSLPVSSLKLSNNGLELTLAESISDAQAGLRVRYTPPSSGATLKDWAGNAVAAFERSVATVDAVAPSLVSSRFTANTQLELTFNEALGSLGPDKSVWSLSANGGAVLKPTSSSISGTRLTLNFDTAVQTGQAATLSYTAPTDDPTVLNLALQDGAGNDSASFSSAPDTTTPTLLTATTSSNGLQILLNYNEALLSPNSSGTPVIPALSTSAFRALKGNGAEVAISSVSISGTQVQLNLASALLPNETLGLFYVAPASNISVTNAAIQDSSGNDAASLGSGVNGQPVTNNALPAVSQLLLDSQAAALDRVVISLNVAAVDPLPAASAFTVKVGSSTQAISGISRSGQDLVLQLTSPITAAGSLLVSYTQPNTNPLKDANGKLMANFSDQSFGQVITGTDAADTLVGQAGRVDYFLGSKGTDSLEGRGAADHFVWPDFSTGGPGGFTQTIKDFGFKRGSGSLQGTLEADLLDLSQLLDGYTSSSTLANFVRAIKGTGDKLNIEIDHNGNIDNSGTFTKTATLVFENVTIDASDRLLVNSQFISHNSGNLTLTNVISHLMTEGQLAVL
jgi:uncharacterized repeat protein (TIGR02059 family)